MRTTVLITLLASVLLLSGCNTTVVRPTANDDLFTLQRHAAELYQRKAYRKALPAYQELTGKVPRDAQLWFRLGNIYARLHKPKQAIETYRHALTLDPALSRAWHNMGVIQLREAANTFTQMANKIDPADPLRPRAMRYSSVLLNLLEKPEGDNSAPDSAAH